MFVYEFSLVNYYDVGSSNHLKNQRQRRIVNKNNYLTVDLFFQFIAAVVVYPKWKLVQGVFFTLKTVVNSRNNFEIVWE